MASGRFRALALILAGLAALSLQVSVTATAASKPNGTPHGRPTGRGPGPSGVRSGAGTQPNQGTSTGRSGSDMGQVNPLQIQDPTCGQGLGSGERRNCQITGTPEGRYPTSNYGFDIHIDTGLDNIVGNFQTLLAHLAEAIWMALLFVLNLILTLLSWALALAPFSDNHVMASLSGGLERFYRAFTSPWLVAAMVGIGAWALYRSLVQRQIASSISGSLASVALMLLALWILHHPQPTVGTAAAFSNAAAQDVIAAPERGSLSDPSASYGSSIARAWDAMTLPGFAALNFSDLGWALSAPDPRLLATANRTVCLDNAYLDQVGRFRAQLILTAFLNGDPIDCSRVARSLPAPRTNAEIWLRSSPGSPARNSLWESFSGQYPYSKYLTIQGGGGAWTRLPLVILVGLGLLGGIALLAWLAIRIFVQTAVAFVLVLITPLALFLPAFGERGRAAFLHWGGTLLGALLSKLVYAALLSVALFGTTVISDAVPTGAGAFMGFLVMSAFWWALFLKRNDILSFISVGNGAGGWGAVGRLGSLFAFGQVARVAGTTGAAASKTATVGRRAVARGASRHVAARRDAVESAAASSLDRQASKRLGARYTAARSLVAEQAAREEQLRSVAGERTDAVRSAREARRLAERTDGPARERHMAKYASERRRAEVLEGRRRDLSGRVEQARKPAERARAFVEHADEAKRTTGRRFPPEAVEKEREGLRREIDRPVTADVHAWRVGLTPERYRGLSGKERREAHAEVDRQLGEDRRAFGAVADRPAGTVEAPPSGGRAHAERGVRQSEDVGRHRRQARSRMAARRGLSR